MSKAGALLKASQQMKQYLRDYFEAARYSDLASILSDAADAGFTRPVRHATVDIDNPSPSMNPNSMGTHVDLVGGRQAVDRLDALMRSEYKVNPGIMTLLARISNPWAMSDAEVNASQMRYGWHRFNDGQRIDSVIYPNIYEGMADVQEIRAPIDKDLPYMKVTTTPQQLGHGLERLDLNDPARGEFARHVLDHPELHDLKTNPSAVIIDRTGLLDPYGLRAKLRKYDREGFAKGGSVTKSRQWLKGVVEDALNSLKERSFGRTPGFSDPDEAREFLATDDGRHPALTRRAQEAVARDAETQHLRSWVDSTLSKYIKRDYGAEWDPLRNDYLEGYIEDDPLRTMPVFARSATAGILRQKPERLGDNPWLANLDPDAPVYHTAEVRRFEHIIDELKNATRPDTDLPPELRLRPESLNRVSVPDAYRLVRRIDDWRAAREIEANQALANNSATQLIKEYPEGFRWVELRKPEDVGRTRSTLYTEDGKDFHPGVYEQLLDEFTKAKEAEGWKFDEIQDAVTDGRPVSDWINKTYSGTGVTYNEDEAIAQLRDALRYEGDTMGHCVGGYCDQVASGSQRIFSLRDARGEPHVTLEVRPSGRSAYDSWYDKATPEEKLEFEDWISAGVPGRRAGLNAAYLQWVSETGREPVQQMPEVYQVKGKQNLKPNEKYLPFVQDFLLEKQWPIMGDLQNTGLVDYKGATTNVGGLRNLRLPTGYATPRMASQFLQDQGVPKDVADRHVGNFEDIINESQNFAEGGEVKRSSLMERLREWNAARDPMPEYKEERSRLDESGKLGSLKKAWNEFDDFRHAVKAGFRTQYEPDDEGAIGLYLGTLSLPALSEIVSEGSAPDWAMEASDRYDKHLNNLLQRYNLPPTGELDVGDRYGVALGEMLGQLPVPGSMFSKLRRIPGLKKASWLTEYFGPIIEPKPLHYGIGTAIGGTLRQMEGPDEELDELVQNYAKGGPVRKSRQWLKGVVEDALKKFKGSDPIFGFTNEVEARAALQNAGEDEAIIAEVLNGLKPELHLNQWIDSTLAKYIKRDLDTEWDPIAQLSPEERHSADWLSNMMVNYVPSQYYRQEPLSLYRKGLVDKNPWVLNLDPNELVYERFMPDDSINHLIDELRNATRPDTDLPPELRLRPESLSRVSVPDASRLVGRINKWRAAQMAEANQALANNPATQLIKEYPEGFRWVELRKPEDTGRRLRTNLDETDDSIPEINEIQEEAWAQASEEGEDLFPGDYEAINRYAMERSIEIVNELKAQDPERFVLDEDEAMAALRNALKYEGDTMGHCVGGYCDDVASGGTRIFSLRDARGEPHVTIEAIADRGISGNRLDALRPGLFDKYVENRGIGASTETLHDWLLINHPDVYEQLINTPVIQQVKGKQNLKPNEKYLPFVQDFLMERQWPIMGDLQNTGLTRIDRLNQLFPNAQNQQLEQALRLAREAGELEQDRRYYPSGKIRDIIMNYLPARSDFAAGGEVKRTYNRDQVSKLVESLIGA